MATTEPLDSLTLPQQNYSPLAAVLSYLVPGLGQVVQGRIGKGLLFFFGLYGLFFYGQYLGGWQNVYIYDSDRPAQQGRKSTVLEVLVDRVRFFAQFWIGVAAWPAIVQHLTYDRNAEEHPFLKKYQRRPSEEEQNTQLRNSDKTPDLAWMYTVIASVLNILVIYDALAGPAYTAAANRPLLGNPTKEAALG